MYPNGTDKQTDGRTLDRYSMLFAKRGQRKNGPTEQNSPYEKCTRTVRLVVAQSTPHRDY